MSERLQIFSIDKDAYAKYVVWFEEQERKIANKYAGAIGGVYTWSFTATTLGLVIKVTNNLNKEVIDLTDYDMW